ncbi:acyltransferase family protein [Phreatobacter stygius]|uniref:Acyltransferase n=1 Tax=Phreatobacter stygius TaxID=1940610 RepID=A0A4D7B1I7_9HYPH|nr:acyltransferase family protein [Phreatobacter stygius]QCI67474.1 acyltransferase [Phreatobacter stygius]
MAEATPEPAERRIDLDWIRIAAFGLLILYHVGLLYVTWTFHVKSSSRVPGLEPLMLALNPWRLALLFLVSGTATCFMASKLRAGQLAGLRSARLLPPLIFGMLVIVAPQAYLQVVDSFGYVGSFGEFYRQHYLTLPGQFCAGPGGRPPCLILPTWNHLWFVIYLWAYSMVLAAILWLAPGLVRRAEAGLARMLAGPGILLWPCAVLVVYRVVLFPRFPVTHTLIDDWYAHALYFSVFMFGFLVARSDAVWQALEQWRWPALAGALVAYGLYLVLRRQGLSSELVLAGLRLIYGIDQWCWIAAVLGFGRRWLSVRDTPARRYLTDAVFPYYIVHQTAIIVAAYGLKSYGLPAWLEATLVILATAATCVLTYEVVRRVGWLRPLFGLKPRGRPVADLAPATR